MTEARPVVIAIPVRNSAATLRQTLESALAQTHRRLRIVVVDNASTDDSSAIANDYCRRDRRVELKSFKELVSAEENFNRCLREANGELIAILHSDDLYESDMIAEQVAFLDRHPECDVVFTHAKTIDMSGNVTGARFFPPELRNQNSVLKYNDVVSLVLKYGNFITCPSALMKSETFLKELGGWNGPEFGSSADLDLWLRASKRAPVGFIAAPLMRYRVSEYSFSVHLQKVRTVRHPMFKAIEAHLEAAGDDVVARADLEFLEAKDAAFVCLNHMKRGEPLEDSRVRLSLAGYLRAMLRSKYHRRFARRIAAIGLFELFYRFRVLRPQITALIAKIRS